MKDNHYPPEMADLVRELTAQRKSNAEIARICEESFGLPPLAKTAIASFKTRYGVTGYNYSPEFLELIASLRRKYDYETLLEILRRDYNVTLRRTQLEGICKNHHILSGRTGRFALGNKPRSPAKMSIETRRKIQHTFFKPGNVSWNTQPLGTEIVSPDGYVMVKVSNAPGLKARERWRPKHHLIWEKAHGPIPAGHKVIFLDGDTGHFELSNLALVSAAEHLAIVRRGLRFSDAELTRTGVNIVRLSRAVAGRTKNTKEEK